MTDTIAQRLQELADDPAYAAIRGELLHAAAELNGYRDLLRVIQTHAGWRHSMGYVSVGACYTCGQDIYQAPPSFTEVFRVG